MSRTILFFGNERLATGITTRLPILNELVLNGYDVKAIVITPQSSYRSRKPRPLEVVTFAEMHNIQIIEVRNMKDSIKQLKDLGAEIGLLAAFGKIVPQEVINIFPKGIINVHPSLLPRHRGSMPIEAPILEGETETGVSLMKLVKEMDAGPVYDQMRIKLEGHETKQELADKLGQMGAQRLIELLPEILNDTLIPLEQSDNDVTYDGRITQDMGIMDFNKPAAVLEREIRAFAGWPRSKTELNKKPVVVTHGRAVISAAGEPGKFIEYDGNLAVGTSNGILIIDRLIPANSKEMSGKDYLRGHPL